MTQDIPIINQPAPKYSGGGGGWGEKLPDGLLIHYTDGTTRFIPIDWTKTLPIPNGGTVIIRY